MKEIIADLLGDFHFSGDLRVDSIALLNKHGKGIVSEHTIRVAAQAKELAVSLGENPETAEAAGFLHDISGIIPNEERLKAAEALGVEILEEERPFPFILHQKLSAALAKEAFGVKNEDILSAVGCHTTLKANAGTLDMILFVADKLQWDQTGMPPYMEVLKKGLKLSIKGAAFAFINYQMENRHTLLMQHPWLYEAYEDLRQKILE